MKIVITVILSAFMLLLAYPPGTNTDEVKKLRELILAHAQAIEKGDFETLNKQWYDGEGVSVFEQGSANNSWAEYRDNHLKPELDAFENFKYAYENIKIEAGSQLSFATMNYKLSARYKGKDINSGGLETMIFKKIDGNWRIVHTHISFPRRDK